METHDVVNPTFSQKLCPSLKSPEDHMMPTQMQNPLSDHDTHVIYTQTTLEK